MKSSYRIFQSTCELWIGHIFRIFFRIEHVSLMLPEFERTVFQLHFIGFNTHVHQCQIIVECIYIPFIKGAITHTQHLFVLLYEMNSKKKRKKKWLNKYGVLTNTYMLHKYVRVNRVLRCNNFYWKTKLCSQRCWWKIKNSEKLMMTGLSSNCWLLFSCAQIFEQSS